MDKPFGVYQKPVHIKNYCFHAILLFLKYTSIIVYICGNVNNGCNIAYKL